MTRAYWAVVAALLFAHAASAESLMTETPRTGALQFKLGPYDPRASIDAGLAAKPYESTFGTEGMLLGELQYDRYLWQKLGAFGIGASVGYAEKYGKAFVLDDAGAEVGDRVGLIIAPIKLVALYNFDYLALTLRIPLMPYVRGGLAFVPWWTRKAGEVEISSTGKRGEGSSWGLTATGGVAFLMDVLDQRLSRDFDNDLGVNHTWLFAEYSLLQADNFGGAGLDVSDGHFMFGMTLEF